MVGLEENRCALLARIEARRATNAKLTHKLSSQEFALQPIEKRLGAALGAGALRVAVGTAVRADEEVAFAGRHRATLAHPRPRVNRRPPDGMPLREEPFLTRVPRMRKPLRSVTPAFAVFLAVGCAGLRGPRNAHKNVSLSVRDPEHCNEADPNAPPPDRPGSPAVNGAPTPTPTPTPGAETAVAEASIPPAMLVLGEASPPPISSPNVRIASPAAGAHVDPGSAVELHVTGWPTTEGAAHVHLILDGQPYKPIYDTSAPTPLRALNGDTDLAHGPHVLVAFASRANHESVKTAGALAVAPFVVGPTGAAAAPPSFAVYSRPKGTYAGPAANHILVDFQLVGTTLAEGRAAVALEVRSDSLPAPLTARVTSFGRPYYLENLRSGVYAIELTLLDADGRPVPGEWNKTTRTIVVDRSARPSP